jgi:DNA-binding transcriptional LysR family regulator
MCPKHERTLVHHGRLVYGADRSQHDCPVMFEKLFAQSGLSLDRLRAFAEIVAAGGITAASGDDSNRQSQFSRQLKELERYFGVELLVRGRGPMTLTDAGKRLYQIVGHAFGALEEFRQTCAGEPVELVIGAGESLIQWLLLPSLGTLTTKHPRLKVVFQNLQTEDILRGLAEGSVDFGVVSRLNANRALASLPLGRLDYGLFLPPALLSSRRRFRHPSEVLNGLPLAALHGNAGIWSALEAEAQKYQLKLDVRLRFSSYPQLAQAVQKMKVAAIMPTLAAHSLPPGGFQLIRLPFLDSLSRRLLLAWNRKLAEVRPAIRLYSKELAGAFARNESKP